MNTRRTKNKEQRVDIANFFKEKTSLLLNKKLTNFEDFPLIRGKSDSLFSFVEQLISRIDQNASTIYKQ